MQDTNPLTWGALDRFQAHCIVRREVKDDGMFVARTVLKTKGYFGAKRVTGVSWTGGKLADVLNSDAQLSEQIAKLPPAEAEIFIEPTRTGVRMRSGWKNHLEFGISRESFDMYDSIAGHIKSL